MNPDAYGGPTASSTEAQLFFTLTPKKPVPAGLTRNLRRRVRSADGQGLRW